MNHEQGIAANVAKATPCFHFSHAGQPKGNK